MLACHRLSPAAWPGNGKWFDGMITEAMAKESWDKIALKLCSQWNVFAVDLQNEPHGSSWGLNMGETSDWGHAAERLGNHVLSRCSRWLVMVEGVGYDPGSSDQDKTEGIFWGENLAGALQQPVRLSDQSKLVFSPHTYGPSVYVQDYFKSPSAPAAPSLARTRATSCTHRRACCREQSFPRICPTSGMPASRLRKAGSECPW
jgi:endoglucanase